MTIEIGLAWLRDEARIARVNARPAGLQTEVAVIVIHAVPRTVTPGVRRAHKHRVRVDIAPAVDRADRQSALHVAEADGDWREAVNDLIGAVAPENAIGRRRAADLGIVHAAAGVVGRVPAERAVANRRAAEPEEKADSSDDFVMGDAELGNLGLFFHFIPTWFSGRFDTMLQTSELCEKLLPKFLNENPTKDDIEKTEIILHYIFQIGRVKNPEESLEGEGNSYYSRVYLHFLSDKFNKNDLIPKAAKYCSNKFILELGRTIKLLLLDYPRGIQTRLNDGDKEYEIKVLVSNEDLLISSKLANGEFTNGPESITAYENLNEDELMHKLVSLLKQQGINYIPTVDDGDTFKRLNFSLNNDLFSVFGFTSIRKLDDKFSHNDKVVNVFSLIFRDFLNEKAKQKS